MSSNVFIKLTSDASDRILYLLVLGIGALTIVLTKFWGQNVLAVVIAVVLIVLYAITCTLSERFRLPEERVGDNCYYLGFIFTLISLAFALWAFDKGRQTEELVSDFGLALASTIVGIGTRVIIQQFRLDTEEIENATRLSLTEAADLTKAELLNAVSEVQKLSLAYRDRLAELNGELTRDAVSTVEQLKSDLAHHKALSTSLRQSYDRLGKSHKESTDALTVQLALLAPALAAQKVSLDGALSEFSSSIRGLRLEVPPNLFGPIEAASAQSVASISEFSVRLLAAISQYEKANFQIPDSAFEPLRISLLAVSEQISQMSSRLGEEERKRLLEVTTVFGRTLESNSKIVSDGLASLAAQSQSQIASSHKLEKNTDSLIASIGTLNSAISALSASFSEASRRTETSSTTFSIFGRRP
jgi:hypothetical protein